MKKIIVVLMMLGVGKCFGQAVWTPMGQGFNKEVYSLYADTTNNFLYAGGKFDSSGTTQLNHIAYWDGAQWSPLGAGFNNSVRAITSYNGELYATGDFTYSDTTALNHIAKWNGSSWVDVGGGLINGLGLALFNFNGNLYVGGVFGNAGGQSCKYIAKWDGANWQSLDTNIVHSAQAGTGTSIMTIGSYQNKLVIGGSFIAGGTANNIAVLDNGIWQPLSIGTNSWVTSMREINNELFVTGYFSQAGSVISICIAKWDGSSWSSFFGPTTSLVNCNTIVNDNLVFGGYLNSFYNANISSLCVANFNTTNQSWSGISTGMTGGLQYPAINSLATIGNTIYAGGSFDTASSSLVKNIAKIDATTLTTGNIEHNSGISIFPNPTTGKFTIETTTNKIESIKILNLLGETVFQSTITNHQSTIDMSAVAKGIYFVQITDEAKNEVTKKLVME